MQRVLQRRQLYHVDKILGVATDMITNGSSFPGSRKCVVGAIVGAVRTSNAIVAASKGSVRDVGLCNST